MANLMGTLKVHPEQMQAAAAELAGYVQNMNNCFQTMKQTMQNTVNYWTGDASNAHRKLYTEQVAKTEEFIARCQEHIRDLNTMAGVYTEAEQSAQAQLEELPTINL